MAIRAPSVARMWLPAIQHPSSRMGHPEHISVTGYGARAPSTSLSLLTGSLDTPFRSQSVATDFSFAGEKGARARAHPDPDHAQWTELPMLGQRVAAMSPAVSQVSENSSTINNPLLKEQVDQLEESLKERIQSTGALTLKTMFKNNHPDGKPVANRSVLLMILTKFLRRLVTTKQLKLLLQRLQLSDRALVSFEEFYGALRDPDPPAMLTLPKTLSLLRGVAHTRFMENVENLMDEGSLSQSWISAPQLRNILEKLRLRLQEPVFEQLWKRLDSDGIGAVRVSVLLQKLGLDKKNKLRSSDENVQCSSPTKAIQETVNNIPDRTLKAEEERQASMAMEAWLKDRFRTGVQRMKAEFDKRDPDGCGKVSNEDFLQVLATFDLKLKREHLGLFLSRCGLGFRKGGVDYTRFLRTFQDRSQDGVTHKIISNPQHRFHSEGKLLHGSSVTEVEAKLTRLLHSEYLSLLEAFQNIDKLNKGIITQEEFKTAVENRFGLQISDWEFGQLVDRLPLDRSGNVQYGVFMAGFDTRKGVPSLFEAGTTAGHQGLSEKALDEEEEKTVVGNGRGVTELSKLIRNTVAQHYRDVVKVFEELDEKNTRRLTQEDMYQLLKRFPVLSEITRGEVRHLWSSLLTRQDGTVEFEHFIRHFGPSPTSRRYPNSKRCPPKRGDNDLMRLSKNLSYVSDILVDSLRAKVELSVAELWAEFTSMDMLGTGSVSREEFKEVLTSLCVLLNQYECEVLANKFDLNNDGRVSYREFLRPFASQGQEWTNGFNMAAALHSHRETGDSPRNMEVVSLETLSTNIRKRLGKKRRAIRKACQRLDASSCGHLSAAELVTVLQLCGVCKSPEELKSVISVLSTDPTGHLDYRPLLQTKQDTSQNDQQHLPHLSHGQKLI
ncbi:EF-hand calcium-binding domain-containing protein 6 [Astyanax mexicanus]|uniref:EF-hand calcium-binding domain-containing protein 6 n=1 Tax=Astyanax mexicanus TaxID=7994 RepID=UPI0020CB59F9|nr:EF-hand calcium-binding domain-containing protein 6 [Astyanax mexicanus]XP_007232855.3 EF-hand calcium-binding domain-containing protein 6 [Astyanax mexicanus]